MAWSRNTRLVVWLLATVIVSPGRASGQDVNREDRAAEEGTSTASLALAGLAGAGVGFVVGFQDVARTRLPPVLWPTYFVVAPGGEVGGLDRGPASDGLNCTCLQPFRGSRCPMEESRYPSHPTQGAAMRRLAFAFLIPLLLPPSPPSLHAQEESDARWIAECDEHGGRPVVCDVIVESVASPAATIAFDGGRNGGVVYTGWDQSGMEVRARIQAHGDTEAEARALARSIRLELGPGGGRAIGPDDKGWSVVFHVSVPRRVNLEATAHNGPVSARGVSGRIRLETQNGPIGLEDLGGDVLARAQNGPLNVKLSGGTWQGEKLDAETQNGPISLSIPAGYDAVLETGTVNGPFSTEIPLQVTLQPGRTPRRFQAVMGDGGPLVRVVTTNGPAKIKGR